MAAEKEAKRQEMSLHNAMGKKREKQSDCRRLSLVF